MTTAFNEYLFLIQFGPAVLKSVSVLAIDAKDPEMKIVYSSPLLDEMFGYEEGTLRGQSVNVLLKDEDIAKHGEDFINYRANPTTRSMNAGVWVEAKKKDGTVFQIQVSLCPQEVGRMDCIVACVADVTKVYNRLRPDVFPH